MRGPTLLSTLYYSAYMYVGLRYCHVSAAAPGHGKTLTKKVVQQGSWTDGEKTDERPFHATNC